MEGVYQHELFIAPLSHITNYSPTSAEHTNHNQIKPDKLWWGYEW